MRDQTLADLEKESRYLEEEERLLAAAAKATKAMSRDARIDLAVNLAISGIASQRITKILGISRTTLYRWKQTERYRAGLDGARKEFDELRLDLFGSIVQTLLKHVHAQINRGDAALIMQLTRIVAPRLMDSLLERETLSKGQKALSRVEANPVQRPLEAEGAVVQGQVENDSIDNGQHPRREAMGSK